MERRMRVLEMNVDLALSYVREIAKTHLTAMQIHALEKTHEDSLASLDDVTDPGGE